ncbi:ADP-ribosyltransferase [Nocardiopsis lambiniae]|uniref:ADP-ribosyltransferase n=1 Tax=Nocardiopsis lambiniae TaxID=3075539 RepID=A0ABU2M932_9ACTN|nr:ADP-ribosyltransferase [Nocardiopsis sp. DSM 44743]MDT0329183.1 ADP-ribosyltransferase [Nocardiopsis sp. DSM 44743]
MDPDELETTATRLTGTAGDIGRSGGDITASWAGLGGVYSAPEAETLFAKMDPVSSHTLDVQEAVETVADALSEFAADAREAKSKLVSLKSQAETLRADIGTDEDWAEDDDLRDRNNSLNNRIASAVFDYQYAERNCANKITRLFGGTYFAGWSELSPEVPGRTSDGREKVYYGSFKPLVDAVNPWGSPVDAPPAGGVLGDGMAALGDMGMGALLGLGAASGVYRDGRAAYPFGTEWQENMGAYFGDLKEGYATLTGFYVDGQWTGHDSVDEWYAHFRGPAGELLGSLVAYDQWEERPAYSITTGVANAALMAGGVGVFKFLLDGPSGLGGGPDGPSDSSRGGEGSSGNGGLSSGDRPGASSLPGQEGFGTGKDGTPSLNEVRQTLSDLNDLNGADRTEAPHSTGTGPVDSGTSNGQGTSGADTDILTTPSGTADTTSPSTSVAGDTDRNANDPWTAAPVNGTDPAPTANTTNGADPSARTEGTNGTRWAGGTGTASIAHGTGTVDANAPDPATVDPGSGPDGGGNGGGDPQAVTGGQDPNGGQQGGSNSGAGTSPTDSTTTHPVPAPPPDPTAFYPGYLDVDGIRRFADESEVDAYAQQVLLDPTANPHAFDNLPAEQREVVFKYTTNSWINSMARAGSPVEVQRILDRMIDYTLSKSAAGETASVGWELYELNGRVRPTLADLSAASSRTDLTVNQRALIQDIFSNTDPEGRLDQWLKSSGYAGLAADMNGGRYPDAADVGALMSELDGAVDRPLPEPVELVRGVHSLNYMNGFDPSNIYSLVGVPQTEKGYMSTSIGSSPTRVDGKNFPYVMNIQFSGEARGLWVGTRSAYPFQRELILPRGTRYVVERIRPNGSNYVLDVKILD